MSFPNRFNKRPRLVVSWKRSGAKRTLSSIPETVSQLPNYIWSGCDTPTSVKFSTGLERAPVHDRELDPVHPNTAQRDLQYLVSHDTGYGACAFPPASWLTRV